MAENLRFGAPDADDDALFAALRTVRLDELVTLHTSIGGRGAAISGGKRQQLAIARALLRDPQVLLLDEVTSQLDTVNEHALRETIHNISQHATVLVIAHRMATVAAADRIVVLESGTVAATGTHAELIGTSPLYRALASTQLAG